jgi:hypothetical protein
MSIIFHHTNEIQMCPLNFQLLSITRVAELALKMRLSVADIMVVLDITKHAVS